MQVHPRFAIRSTLALLLFFAAGLRAQSPTNGVVIQVAEHEVPNQSRVIPGADAYQSNSTVGYGEPLSSASVSFGDEVRVFDSTALGEDSNVAAAGNFGEIASPDEAVEKLTKQVEDFQSQLKKQDETIGDLKKAQGDLVKLGHGKEKMTLSGRIHLDYWTFPGVDDSLFPLESGDPQDRFLFRRLRFGVKGDIDDNMLYKIEMEFAEPSEPQFRDAYIGFKDLPVLQQLLIGNQKRPYGLDHLESSRFIIFIERPFIVEAFNQDARRLGICSWGVSEDERYNWRFGVFNMRNIQGLGDYVDDHYQLELAGRLATTAWYDETSGGRGYAHFAIAGSLGSPDGADPVENEARYRTRPEARTSNRWLDTGRIAGAESTALLALESVLNFGALQIGGEYQNLNVNRSAGFGNNVDFGGGYVYASYFLTGEHIPWNREEGISDRVIPFENFFCVQDCDGCRRKGLGAWQVAVRYSHADLTDEDIIGGVGDSVTAGLNWHWNPYARMQFNYIWGDINRDPTASGQYSIFGVRFMVDF